MRNPNVDGQTVPDIKLIVKKNEMEWNGKFLDDVHLDFIYRSGVLNHVVLEYCRVFGKVSVQEPVQTKLATALKWWINLNLHFVCRHKPQLNRELLITC